MKDFISVCIEGFLLRTMNEDDICFPSDVWSPVPVVDTKTLNTLSGQIHCSWYFSFTHPTPIRTFQNTSQYFDQTHPYLQTPRQSDNGDDRGMKARTRTPCPQSRHL